jgi:hypothetical protein
MEDIDFEQQGIVSLWVGQIRVAEGSNFLHDGYGVDFYEPDQQECLIEDSPQPLAEILAQLSYAESFRDAALAAAKRKKISTCLWIMAQYDFAYDPQLPGLKTLPQEPVFLGSFAYEQEEY